MTNHTDPDLERIEALEAEGMTTSDAQAVLMAEEMGAKPMRRKGARRTPAEKVAQGKARATQVAKATTTKKGPRPCACGCGELTKGGTYRPGHDSRHHAALRAAGKKPKLIGSAKRREAAATKKGSE